MANIFGFICIFMTELLHSLGDNNRKNALPFGASPLLTIISSARAHIFMQHSAEPIHYNLMPLMALSAWTLSRHGNCPHPQIRCDQLAASFASRVPLPFGISGRRSSIFR